MLHEINTLNPVFRFYMGYLFPILNKIDEGTEEWISPVNLPQVSGSVWSKHNAYFTFLPDFIPMRIMRILQGLEHRLEKSKFARFSAHYLACLKKDISSIEQSKKVC